jgi:hypothetical protein
MGMKRTLFLVVALGLLSQLRGFAQAVKPDSTVVVRVGYYEEGGCIVSYYREIRGQSSAAANERTLAHNETALAELQALLQRQGYTLASSSGPGYLGWGFLIYTKAQ